MQHIGGVRGKGRAIKENRTFFQHVFPPAIKLGGGGVKPKWHRPLRKKVFFAASRRKFPSQIFCNF